MGASLLIFLNKTDVEGCMTEDEARQVRPGEEREGVPVSANYDPSAPSLGYHQNA